MFDYFRDEFNSCFVLKHVKAEVWSDGEPRDKVLSNGGQGSNLCH